MEAIALLPHFTGISVHGGWGSYFLYACSHALCNVHLLRDLTFLAEEQGLWWAAKLKALLLDMKEATEQAREQGKRWLHPLEVADWEARYLPTPFAQTFGPRLPREPIRGGRQMAIVAVFLQTSLQVFHLLGQQHDLLLLQAVLLFQQAYVLLLLLDQFPLQAYLLSQQALLFSKLDQFFFCCHALTLQVFARFDKSLGDLSSYQLLLL